MAEFAKETTVPVERTQAEIERTLQRYGATQFMRGWDQQQAVLAFVIHKKQVRMVVPMPKRDLFTKTPTGKARTSETAITEAWEQACRQRWRALGLVVKAKLEAVEAGISTFEDEFMSHIVLPNGQTAGQWLVPQINKAYETNQMPAFLPMLASGG